jgi:hypothetical protein
MFNGSTLNGLISEIRDYVDCISCPPQRNCCYFDEGHVHYLPTSVLVDQLGEEQVLLMMNEGKLSPYFNREGEEEYFDISANHLFLREQCPLLENNRCKVHNSQSKLGLDDCMDYPIFYDGDELFLEYSCHSIEKNFEKIIPILSEISTMGVEVLIRYYSDNGTKDLENLETFIELRAKRKIPNQKRLN